MNCGKQQKQKNGLCNVPRECF